MRMVKTKYRGNYCMGRNEWGRIVVGRNVWDELILGRNEFGTKWTGTKPLGRNEFGTRWMWRNDWDESLWDEMNGHLKIIRLATTTILDHENDDRDLLDS